MVEVEAQEIKNAIAQAERPEAIITASFRFDFMVAITVEAEQQLRPALNARSPPLN